MHPDYLPSAHDDDKPASKSRARAADDSKPWPIHDATHIRLETIYDQVLVDVGTSCPAMLHGEFRFVGRTWLESVPAYLVERDSKIIYPFHRIIFLRVKAEEDDQSDE